MLKEVKNRFNTYEEMIRVIESAKNGRNIWKRPIDKAQLIGNDDKIISTNVYQFTSSVDGCEAFSKDNTHIFAKDVKKIIDMPWKLVLENPRIQFNFLKYQYTDKIENDE